MFLKHIFKWYSFIKAFNRKFAIPKFVHEFSCGAPLLIADFRESLRDPYCH